MSNILQELVVKLTIDEVGFVTGLRKSLFSAEAWKKAMVPTLSGMDKAFGSIIKSTAALATGMAAAGVAIGTHMVKSSLESIDAMAKLSDRTAINIETLYGFKAAADDTGVSLESVASMVNKLQKNISEAASDPKSDLGKKFKELKLSAESLKHSKPEEAFGKVIDALNAIPNKADQTSAKIQLLGKSANDSNNFLRLGAKGLDEYAKEAIKLGMSVNRIDAAKVEIANDAFTHLHEGIEGVANKLTIALTPYLKAAADALTEFITEGDHGQSVINSLVDYAIEGFKKVSDGIQIAKIGISLFWAIAAKVSQVFYEILESASYAWKYISGLTDNLIDVMEAASNNIRASWEVVWSALKYGISLFVEVASKALSGMIRTALEVAGIFSNDMANSMAVAAARIENSAKEISKSTGIAFDNAKAKAVDAGAAMSAALEKVGDVKVDNSFFEELTKNATEQYDAAADDFVDRWNAPWSSDSIDNWVDHAKTKIQELAEATAASAPGEEGAKQPYNPFKKLPEADKQFADYEKDLNDKMYALTTDQFNWEKYKNENIAIMTQEHLNDMEREEAQSIARTNALRKMGLRGQLIMTSQVLDQLSTLMQAHDKKAFEFGKVAAIANAIINTAQGATKALAQGGFYGISMAAAVVAAGAVQIGQIKSTSFSGGGSGSGGKVGSASTYDASQQNASAKSNGGGGGSTSNVNITLMGDSFNEKQVRSMIDRINGAVGDGARIKVSGG